MNGLLRHSTLLGSQLREDGTVVASGFLQKSAVRNWLGGIVPAWTMLDQKSFEALLLPPLPPVGAIRFATDFSPEEIGHSAVARNALILLHSASVGPGLKLTTTGNLSRSVVAEMCDLFTWPGFDKTEAFRLHKVINEPDFLPLYFVRHLVETAELVRQRKGYLKTTPADSPQGDMLEAQWDSGTMAMEAKILRPLWWFGLFEYRQEEIAGRRFAASHFYRKAPLLTRGPSRKIRHSRDNSKVTGALSPCQL